MKIGIIGAGTMGAGIAQTFAGLDGNTVYLCDINEELAHKGKERIASGFYKRIAKQKMTQEQAETILSRIETGMRDICFDCDLIVEAAVENLEIKQATFRSLHELCKPSCLFATNTSSLSVTKIAQGVGRPIVGMHFFNPAPVMKLVEVVSGQNTPSSLTDAVIEIARSIGKTPVRVKDSAGFVVNRVLIPMINEAIGVYANGVASAQDIDTAMQLGANLPMGPLALGDLIGLDVVLAIMQVLERESNDQKYRPHPLLEQMVSEGKLGKKTSQGFFVY